MPMILMSDKTIPSEHVLVNADGSVSIKTTTADRDSLIVRLREIADDFEQNALPLDRPS